MDKSPTKGIHPGRILMDGFMRPAGLSQNRLAREIGVSPTRINEIVHGMRSITPGSDVRLCRYFGQSEGFWLHLQADYDLAEVRERTMDRTQIQSDLFCAAVARVLGKNPDDVLRIARRNVETWKRGKTNTLSIIGAWEAILSLPASLLAEFLTSRGSEASELRRNNPFAGVLGESERRRIVEYAHHAA